MKFSCDSCGRKYRIEDEKVRGKTLRMDCRKCGKKILIDGKALTASTSERPPTARPAPAASPLSKGFYDQVSRPQADVGGGLAAREPKQWHVEINNVAVGPIGRSEVARKVETGAVKASSLCWREGFDDWRPLHTVSELAALLQPAKPAVPKPVQLRRTPPPPPPRSANRLSGPRGAPAAIGGRAGASAAVAMAPSPLSSLPERESQPEPRSFSSVPAPTPAPIASIPPLVSDAPIAGSASADAWSDLGTADDRTMVDAPITTPSEAAPFGKKKAAPLMLYLMAGAGGLFLMAIGILVGAKYLGGGGTSEPAPEQTQEQTTVAEEQKAPDIEIPLDETEGVVEEETAAEETGETTGKATTRKTTRTTTTSKKPDEPQMSEADRRRLEQMGQGGINLKNVSGSSNSGSSGSGGTSLTGEQISPVAARGKRNVERCYEKSVRGMSNVAAFRVVAKIKISGAGRVTSVSLSGNDINGLKACMSGEIRRWVFPKAGASSEVSIPYAFQGT